MISVGIDVSKGKSTVCAVKPYGEILLNPRDYTHTTTDLNILASHLKKYDEEIHVIMEATGSYHLPIATFMRNLGYQVYVINPLEMKRYRCQGIRNPKTDRIDALIIAQYGIDFWYRKHFCFCRNTIVETLKNLEEGQKNIAQNFRKYQKRLRR